MADSFIELKVKNDLSKDDAKLWKSVVESNGPAGILGSAEVKPGHVSSFFKINKKSFVVYIIPLLRDLTEEEVKKIFLAWNRVYKTGDFEIDYSTIGFNDTKLNSFKENSTKDIIENLAKKNHQIWCSRMNKEGWSYGPKLVDIDKKHPMLLPWYELADKYKENKIQQVLDFFDSLNDQNLVIGKV